jgi:two-component system chemotaxis response regulator CheY
MGAGATDYFTKPINEKLFFVRLKNYEALLKSTHDRAGTNEWAINPFASKVYSRKTVFRVTKESSLGEFWEYFILKQNILTKDMSDCVKAIYNTGLVLLKSHKLFDIIVEEDDETFYFTIVKIDGYNKKKIKAIFENEFPQSTRKLGEGALSLILKKSIFELENAYYDTDIKLPMPQAEQKKIDYNMPVYEEDESKRILRHSFVEKTTASAFLSEIDETYLDKIDALEVTEDDLDSDIFELETSGKIDYVYKIAHSMIDYADAVEAINEFGNITYALYRLAENLINLKSADIDEKKLAKLTLMLKSLHADLTQWRANIFVTKITQDIHYLDSSLISSCMQIDYIFKDVQVIDEDGDLELF